MIISSDFENLKIYFDEKFSTIEKQISGLRADNKEIRAELKVLEKNVERLNYQVEGINSRIDDIKFFVTLSFGALAIVAALLIFAEPIARMFRALFRPKFPAKEIQAMIDASIEKILRERNS